MQQESQQSLASCPRSYPRWSSARIAEALKAALKSPEMAETAADAQTFDVESTVMFSGEVVETAL